MLTRKAALVLHEQAKQFSLLLSIHNIQVNKAVAPKQGYLHPGGWFYYCQRAHKDFDSLPQLKN